MKKAKIIITVSDAQGANVSFKFVPDLDLTDNSPFNLMVAEIASRVIQSLSPQENNDHAN